MFSVFADPDHMKVQVAKLALENEGIPCFIRNDLSSNLLVGNVGPIILKLPIFDPELCVLNEQDLPKAKTLVAELFAADTSAQKEETDATWQCPNCGEPVPTNFTECWNCEAPATSA